MPEQSQQLSPDALQLYQQALLKHHKAPVGFELEFEATHKAEGINAACGDEIVIYTKINAGVISKLGFSGDSCAICRASASMMCQHLIDRSSEQCIEQSIEQIKASIENIIAIINSPSDEKSTLNQQLQPLLAVRKFPVRKQCAILPWRTFAQALSTSK